MLISHQFSLHFVRTPSKRGWERSSPGSLAGMRTITPWQNGQG